MPQIKKEPKLIISADPKKPEKRPADLDHDIEQEREDILLEEFDYNTEREV